MKRIAKPFEYHSADESRRPGYLRRRFAEIRRAQVKASERKPDGKVLNMPKKA